MRDRQVDPFLFFGVMLFVLGTPLYISIAKQIFGNNSSNVIFIVYGLIAVLIGIYLRYLGRSMLVRRGGIIGNYILNPQYTLKRKIVIILLAIFSFVAAIGLFVLLSLYNVTPV